MNGSECNSPDHPRATSFRAGWFRAAGIVWVFIHLLALDGATNASAQAPQLPKGPLTSQQCKTCHAREYAAWQISHHAQAMSLNTTTPPLADFDNQTASHYDVQGRFHRVDGRPVMTLTNGRHTSHHIVTDSFGIHPLQQYLTEVGNGRKQVLPFAWDSRSAEEGGQQWLSIQGEEEVTQADRLHWRQPLANWNGMCADCHATGLRRNYDPQQTTFATTFHEPNVGCGSCHGDEPHTNNPVPKHSAAGFTPRYPLSGAATIARDPAAAHRTMEVCAGCHSLRSPLQDGIRPDHSYLDQFTPSLIEPALYFPDGQIKEEVYVWGSFLQSRMHAEGVTCGNCHDPHSQSLKATGNALCGQCHQPTQYNHSNHHHHPQASKGAQCVNCHMPSRTYMAVDDRRDHSFHIPDPATSLSLGSPDPCTSCHTDQTPAWAAQAIDLWRNPASSTVAGDDAPRNPEALRLWQAQQSGTPLRAEQLSKLLNHPTLSEIRKATALQQYARTRDAIQPTLLAPHLQGDLPLLTLAAINASRALPPVAKQELLGPLLSHPRRALRVAAANQLRTVLGPKANTEPPASPLIEAYLKARSEADSADTLNSWRGEGLLNKALRLEQNSQLTEAVAIYQQSIEIDPYFEASYVNLAELYRRLGDARREQLLYSKALQALPNSGLLRYSYALHLIRRKNTKAALIQVEEAINQSPDDPQSAYLYLLLLDNAGRTKEANRWLFDHLNSFRGAPQILQIGLKHARSLGDETAATQIYRALQALQYAAPTR